MPKLRALFLAVFIGCGSGCFVPGGGGSSQEAPDVVKAGEPITIRLRVSVWGSGGNVQGRYTDVVLNYRLVGDSHFKSIGGVLSSGTSPRGRAEFYTFEGVKPIV